MKREEEVIKARRPIILDIVPYRLSLATIRRMTDEQLLRALTGEIGETRPLDFACQQAISAELMRRQAAKFERPLWWKDRNYWVALVAAIGGVIAATPIVWGWLTK